MQRYALLSESPTQSFKERFCFQYLTLCATDHSDVVSATPDRQLIPGLRTQVPDGG